MKQFNLTLTDLMSLVIAIGTTSFVVWIALGIPGAL